MKKFFSVFVLLLIVVFSLVGCDTDSNEQQIPLNRLSSKTQTESIVESNSQQSNSKNKYDEKTQETSSFNDDTSQSINFLGWVDYDPKFEDMDRGIGAMIGMSLPAKDKNESANKFASDKEAIDFINKKIMPNDMMNLEYTTSEEGEPVVVFTLNAGGGTGSSSYQASENNGSVIFVIEYNSDYYMNPWNFYYEESTKTLYVQMKEDHRTVKSMEQINNAPGGLLYTVFEDFNTDVENIALIKPNPEDKEF